MAKYIFIPVFLFSAIGVARADLVLEQQLSDTNHTRTSSLKLHSNKMRMDDQDDALTVIADLNTRDSLTLLTSNKMFLRRFGSEIRWEMQEEKKFSGGTNEMDEPPAAAVDTGKSEIVNGRVTEIFTWSGARGVTETLWVDKKFPNYDAIRMELAKLDRFNDSGPHRNAQPELSRLPGMVIKSESIAKGRIVTNTLVSVKLEPVDVSLFELPTNFSPWKADNKKP